MKKQILTVLLCMSFSTIINAVARGTRPVTSSSSETESSEPRRSFPAASTPSASMPAPSSVQADAASLKLALANGSAAPADVAAGLAAGLRAKATGANTSSPAYNAAMQFASA